MPKFQRNMSTVKVDKAKRERLRLEIHAAIANKFENGVQKFGYDWGGDNPLIEGFDDGLDVCVYLGVAKEYYKDEHIKNIIEALETRARILSSDIKSLVSTLEQSGEL